MQAVNQTASLQVTSNLSDLTSTNMVTTISQFLQMQNALTRRRRTRSCRTCRCSSTSTPDVSRAGRDVSARLRRGRVGRRVECLPGRLQYQVARWDVDSSRLSVALISAGLTLRVVVRVAIASIAAATMQMARGLRTRQRARPSPAPATQMKRLRACACSKPGGRAPGSTGVRRCSTRLCPRRPSSRRVLFPPARRRWWSARVRPTHWARRYRSLPGGAASTGKRAGPWPNSRPARRCLACVTRVRLQSGGAGKDHRVARPDRAEQDEHPQEDRVVQQPGRDRCGDRARSCRALRSPLRRQPAGSHNRCRRHHSAGQCPDVDQQIVRGKARLPAGPDTWLSIE